MAEVKTVTITVDGKSISAPAGTLLIDAHCFAGFDEERAGGGRNTLSINRDCYSFDFGHK